MSRTIKPHDGLTSKNFISGNILNTKDYAVSYKTRHRQYSGIICACWQCRPELYYRPEEPTKAARVIHREDTNKERSKERCFARNNKAHNRHIHE